MNADMWSFQQVSIAATIMVLIVAGIAVALLAYFTRQLREREQRFRQVTEALHAAVSLTDARLTSQLFVNRAFEDIWGLPSAALFANPLCFLEAVHPEDQPRVRAAVQALPQRTFDMQFRIVRPDGSIRWVWSRRFGVRDGRGNVYRIAGITEDITEWRRISDSRIRLMRGFTHDVKNPLGAADGHLALLEEGISGPLPAAQLQSVHRARRLIGTALNLTTQLLDIARAEAGQLEVKRERVDIALMACQIFEDFKGEADARHQALTLEGVGAGADGQLMVESDTARIRQVLANLVSNAVKYTQSGGSITIRAASVSNGDPSTPAPGDWVSVAVSDNGPGIAPDKLDTLFLEFARFDPTAAQGSGIGLAISDRIARALGATISVDSRIGSGSTFTLWLPGQASRPDATTPALSATSTPSPSFAPAG